MPKTRVNQIDLHYITVGAGPDVVMLHGLLGNLAVWHLHIVPELRREFRITAYDLRGHGYSDVTRSGYSTDEMARELEGLLDALGIERPYLVGHSFGADIGLNLALLCPERIRGLVLIDPTLPALVDQRKSTDWVGWKYWVAKLEEVGLRVPPDKQTDLSYLLNLSVETPKFYGPARGLPRRREPLLNLLRNTTLVEDYEKVESLTLDSIRGITTPTLLVSGERSQFLGTYAFLRETLPNCTSRLMPGGEHFGPLEQPGYLATHMRAFFHHVMTDGRKPFLLGSADDSSDAFEAAGVGD
ncbi:MAG: alpha/beta fold hydrolase [Luteitalea sp.]|nr:alpha/beta fold hydrolase [Luteitalea sp.]